MFFYGHVKTGSSLRSAALCLKWPRNSFVRFFQNRGDQYFYPAHGLSTSRLAGPGSCS
jgi:hypothetical protein